MKESTETQTTPNGTTGQPGVGCERGLGGPRALALFGDAMSALRAIVKEKVSMTVSYAHDRSDALLCTVGTGVMRNLFSLQSSSNAKGEVLRVDLHKLVAFKVGQGCFHLAQPFFRLACSAQRRRMVRLHLKNVALGF